MDRLVWTATQPIRVGLAVAVERAAVAWRSYVDLRNARAELGQARIRLRRAEGELDALEAVEAENRALRRLLQLGSQRPDREPTAAHVIGSGFAPGARTIEIDRGAVHGLARGQPVVDAEGLVGLVQRASWTSSEVVLAIDRRSTVLARVARTRVSGRVRGDEESLVMDDVSRDGEVAIGDLVVTSGLGHVFPPNVPIGRVEAIEVADRRRRLRLKPAVDFSRLDGVAVLPVPRPPLLGPTPPLLRPPELWPPPVERDAEEG